MILKLQGTDGMGDPLDGVLDGVGEVIHGIDAPLVSGVVVGHVGYPVDDRVAHIDIRGSHIDLRPQHLLAVGVFSGAHLLEEP